jgi:c-di-GMP-binding flagellar brake protein YcgR
MAELTAGVKLNVFVPSGSDQDQMIKLTSSLEGIGDKRVVITAPTKGDTPYPIHPGQEVKLQCHMANSIVDFDAKVVQKIEKGILSYFLLAQTSDFRRTQRRQDFRLDCTKNGQIEYVDPADNATKRVKVVVTDISGGGTSVRCPIKYYLGEKVAAFLPIGDNDAVLKYMCHVRRCFEVGESIDAMKYNVGLQFEFKDNRQKEDLIARIFKMEREKRRSEK